MEEIKRLLSRLRRPVDPERALARAQAERHRRAARAVHDRHTAPGFGGGDS